MYYSFRTIFISEACICDYCIQ